MTTEARKIAREALKPFFARPCSPEERCACDLLTDDIAAAIRKARREGIEEAAKVADEQKMLDAAFDVDLAWNGACHDIVAAIRALKDKQP